MKFKRLKPKRGGRPTRYMMSLYDWKRHKRKTAPRLLRGNIPLFLLLLGGFESSHGYASFVLSFLECHEFVGDDNVFAVVNSFLALVFASIDPGDFAEPIVVLHERAEGGFDIHILLLQVHLPTGRFVTLYVHKLDKELFSIWAERWNIERCWVSPLDPRTWSLSNYPPQRLTQKEHDLFKRIDGAATNLVETGVATNREELISHLKNTFRNIIQYSRSILIRDVDGTAVHLVGKKYDKQFTRSRYLESKSEGQRNYANQDQYLVRLNAMFDELITYRKRRLKLRLVYTFVEPAPLTKGERVRRANLARNLVNRPTKNEQNKTSSYANFCNPTLEIREHPLWSQLFTNKINNTTQTSRYTNGRRAITQCTKFANYISGQIEGAIDSSKIFNGHLAPAIGNNREDLRRLSVYLDDLERTARNLAEEFGGKTHQGGFCDDARSRELQLRTAELVLKGDPANESLIQRIVQAHAIHLEFEKVDQFAAPASPEVRPVDNPDL